MTGKDKPADDKNWAGKEFSKRNPESAPEPEDDRDDDE